MLFSYWFCLNFVKCTIFLLLFNQGWKSSTRTRGPLVHFTLIWWNDRPLRLPLFWVNAFTGYLGNTVNEPSIERLAVAAPPALDTLFPIGHCVALVSLASISCLLVRSMQVIWRVIDSQYSHSFHSYHCDRPSLYRNVSSHPISPLSWRPRAIMVSYDYYRFVWNCCTSHKKPASIDVVKTTTRCAKQFQPSCRTELKPRFPLLFFATVHPVRPTHLGWFRGLSSNLLLLICRSFLSSNCVLLLA